MAKSKNNPAAARESPVMLELLRLDTGSAVAVVGHPIHVMMVHFPIAFVIATLGVDVFYWWSGDPFWVRVGLWAAGFTFWTGVRSQHCRHWRALVGARHPGARGELVACRGGDDFGRDHRGELGTAVGLPRIDPAARSCALRSRRGDGRLRRLARRQARV